MAGYLMQISSDLHIIFQNVALYLITGLLGYVAFKIKILFKTWEFMKKALQITLSQHIHEEYKKAISDGWISLNTFKRVEAIASAYHGLDGNGATTELWEIFKKLPLKEPEEVNNGRL